jgi:hypothetical protein
VATPASEAREFVERFVVPGDRDRQAEWASLAPIVDPRLHKGLVAALRPDAVECVEGIGRDVVETVLTRLQALGASEDCLVVCTPAGHLEGRERLSDVLKDTLGWQPCTLLSCVRGELYYLEDFGDRHLIIHDPVITTT